MTSLVTSSTPQVPDNLCWLVFLQFQGAGERTEDGSLYEELRDTLSNYFPDDVVTAVLNAALYSVRLIFWALLATN